MLIASLGLQAQQAQGHVKIEPILHQSGWFTVQFLDANSPYALKALMPEQAGKAAVIQRLYIDDVTHIARVEVVNHQLSADSFKAAIEQKIVPIKQPKLNALNQPVQE